MKIAIADNTGLKFAKEIKEHWEKNGNEVRYERGASEHLAQWADLYYVEWSDNNIHYLYDLYHGDPRKCRPANWDNNKKPKFVVRAIDWDVWLGHARSQDLVSWVDQWICIAPHIERKLKAEAQYRPGQLRLIRPGIDLHRFTPKSMQTDGFQLGMVLGDLWTYKNHMAGLDIFTMLYQEDPQWRLHIRGQHEPGEFNPVMYDYFLASRGIRDVVTLYPPVNDMNAWYEKIDTLLHPGMKETFCYAVGEAMAKGIPAVVNNFYGATEIWNENMLYNTSYEAKKMIDGLRYIQAKICRTYIQEKHNVETMLQSFDELLFL